MNSQQTYKIVLGILFGLPLCLMIYKWAAGYLSPAQLIPEAHFDVRFDYEAKTKGKEAFVKSFLPTTNERQAISQTGIFSGNASFETETNPAGLQGKWTLPVSEHKDNLSFNFHFEGTPIKYQIDKKLKVEHLEVSGVEEHLQASEYIQSDHARIRHKAQYITAHSRKVDFVLQNIYKFVYEIPSNKSSDLMDALSALEAKEASCNGKSRLFVAMCRAKGIPARVVGGIILKNERKKTSHAWAEVYMNGNWIPFDPLNGYYAHLPAHYLELYKGDEFLIRRTSDMGFDFAFDIQRSKEYGEEAAVLFTLRNLPAKLDIAPAHLKAILCLPLCALLIALFRNVIGLKTFGIFLPAIITISLEGTGLVFGLLLYATVVAVVGLLHFPLTRWGLLYTPKMAVMLVGVILAMLGLTYLGIAVGSMTLSSVILFPIIILAIAAEKFAKTIDEEGMKDALKLQGQTLFVVVLCYFVVASEFLGGFLITCPEVLLLITGCLMLLGRWIGLRLSEYKRFSWVIS